MKAHCSNVGSTATTLNLMLAGSARNRRQAVFGRLFST
jgi:hypothetical protein